VGWLRLLLYHSPGSQGRAPRLYNAEMDPRPYSRMSQGEMVRLVYQSNPQCTCDECQPSLYTRGACVARHLQIHQHAYHTQFHPVPRIVYGKHYEALHLARAAIAYFDRSELGLTSVQKEALDRLRRVFHSRCGLSGGDTVQDGYQLSDVLHMINHLFFFGALQAVIMWAQLIPNRLGQYQPATRTIKINSRAAIFGVGAAEQQRGKLATILHEAMHAFLRQLSCCACPTYYSDVDGAGGHGRAFQLLSTTLKKVTMKLLGTPLDPTGFRSFAYEGQYLPSVHDVETWQWSDGNPW